MTFRDAEAFAIRSLLHSSFITLDLEGGRQAGKEGETRKEGVGFPHQTLFLAAMTFILLSGPAAAPSPARPLR